MSVGRMLGHRAHAYCGPYGKQRLFFFNSLPKTALRLLFSSFLWLVTWKHSSASYFHHTDEWRPAIIQMDCCLFFFFNILHKCYANNCGPRWAEAPALLPVFLNTLMFCEEMNRDTLVLVYPPEWICPSDFLFMLPIGAAGQTWSQTFNTLTPVSTAQVNLYQVDKRLLNGVLNEHSHCGWIMAPCCSLTHTKAFFLRSSLVLFPTLHPNFSFLILILKTSARYNL